MFTRKSLLMTAVLGMLVSANVALADGVRSAGAKLLGDYGDRPAATQYRSQPMDRATAPATTRSFSYDPAQQPAAGAPCPGTKTPSAAAPQARRSPTAQRSFSYEPATPNYTPSRRYESRTPAYLLPKTDSRKYSGF